MSKRVLRRRRREEWLLILERFRISGLDARAFCARERIGYASFRAWRRKLKQPATASDGVLALPASSSQPFIDLGAMVAPTPMALEVELELGGQVLLRLKRT